MSFRETVVAYFFPFARLLQVNRTSTVYKSIFSFFQFFLFTPSLLFFCVPIARLSHAALGKKQHAQALFACSYPTRLNRYTTTVVDSNRSEDGKTNMARTQNANPSTEHV